MLDFQSFKLDFKKSVKLENVKNQVQIDRVYTRVHYVGLGKKVLLHLA